MWKNFFCRIREKDTGVRTISSAAFLIACFGLASRILGLLRDRLLASRFGAGDELDIYYAAFKVPDLIFNFLILGTLSAAFVPVFTALISQEKKNKAWILANKILSFALVILIFVSLVLFFFSPELINLITPGFSSEKKVATVGLTRIMLLSPVILGISGILGGILTSFKRFFFYSLAPVFYNFGIIIGILFFSRFWGLSGLAWGVILGAFFHFLTQLSEVFRCGWVWRWDLNYQDENLKKVFRLIIPRTLGLAATQINLLITTILASTLKAGSLAVFNLANNIQSVPLGMFGISFAVAAFPTLAGCWAREDKKEFKNNFSKTFNSIIFFTIPFSVIFIVLRAQIVRVVLGAGKFDWEDTILTFSALGIFSLSLFAQTTIPLLARSFYAIQDTKTPFLVGLFSEIVNLFLAVFLIKNYQLLGLVWAYSLSVILNMFLLLTILRYRAGDLGEKEIVPFVWKVALASLGMAGVMQITKYGVSFLVQMDTFWGVFIQATSALLLGGGTFLSIALVLKLEKAEKVFSQFKLLCRFTRGGFN